MLAPMQRFGTIADTKPNVHQESFQKHFPRTQTVEFAPDPTIRRRERFNPEPIPEGRYDRNRRFSEYSTFHHGTIPLDTCKLSTAYLVSPSQAFYTDRGRPLSSAPSVPLSIRTEHTHHTHLSAHPVDAMTRNFGGFPSPFSIAKSIIGRLFPGVRRQLTRAVTIPATVSLTPGREGLEPGKKYAPYISFDAVVGRNSKFHLLTQDQLEEIGGVEYRALNALLWIVALVWHNSAFERALLMRTYAVSYWYPTCRIRHHRTVHLDKQMGTSLRPDNTPPEYCLVCGARHVCPDKTLTGILNAPGSPHFKSFQRTPIRGCPWWTNQ